MPKGKRKDKREARRGDRSGTSDDDSWSVNGSEGGSMQSDAKSLQDESEIEQESMRSEAALCDAVEGLRDKAGAGRATALANVRAALDARHVPDAVASRRGTLADAIDRSLRKGRGNEQIAAAKLAPIVCIQLGYEHAEEFIKEVHPALLSVITNKSTAEATRAECCLSLALLLFLGGGDIADILDLMRVYEGIFCGSYLKGDGTVNVNVTAEASALHAAALDAWALLVGLCNSRDIGMLMDQCTSNFAPTLRQLWSLLLTPCVEVRVAAGEALALVFELARDHNENFGELELQDIVEQVQLLSKDSNKYRAKKDRKRQRATFRDILHYLEEEEISEDNIRVGTERVMLESWASRGRYAALANALGGALQVHIPHSDMLRDALQLGPPPLPAALQPTKQRTNKLERHLQNAAAFKARTISRAKNRDKRSAVIAS